MSSSMKSAKLEEENNVKDCYNNWRYETFRGDLEMTLLAQDVKGSDGLASWPNFFIGIDVKGDTIGVVEYESEQQFRPGNRIIFLPILGKNAGPGRSTSQSEEPTLRISDNSEISDFYCSIKAVYYGEMK